MNSSNQIKQFILENISSHQRDIIKAAIHKFGISRQAILKHMNALINENRVIAHGKTRDRFYEIMPQVNYSKSIEITDEVSPSQILKNQILPNFSTLNKNIYEICEFSIMAILANTFEHSKATRLNYKLFITPTETHIFMSDNGLGIFSKIQDKLELGSTQIAVIEVAKGHVTTDPKNHAGEELMTVIRLFDHVTIEASGLCLSYFSDSKNWSVTSSQQTNGTRFHLEIKTNSRRTCQETFHQIFNQENKSVRIPVNLIRAKNELVNSRSQAKKLLLNIREMEEIKFDFNNIELIGPAFADELIRTTKHKNDSADIKWVNSNETVDLLMSRAVDRLT